MHQIRFRLRLRPRPAHSAPKTLAEFMKKVSKDFRRGMATEKGRKIGDGRVWGWRGEGKGVGRGRGKWKGKFRRGEGVEDGRVKGGGGQGKGRHGEVKGRVATETF